MLVREFVMGISFEEGVLDKTCKSLDEYSGNQGHQYCLNPIHSALEIVARQYSAYRDGTIRELNETRKAMADALEAFINTPTVFLCAENMYVANGEHEGRLASVNRMFAKYY